jgi:hypothetical protein
MRVIVGKSPHYAVAILDAWRCARDRSRLAVHRAHHRRQSPRYPANSSAGPSGGLGPLREPAKLDIGFRIRSIPSSVFGPLESPPCGADCHSWALAGRPASRLCTIPPSLGEIPGGLLFASRRRPIPPSATSCACGLRLRRYHPFSIEIEHGPKNDFRVPAAHWCKILIFITSLLGSPGATSVTHSALPDKSKDFGPIQ